MGNKQKKKISKKILYTNISILTHLVIAGVMAYNRVSDWAFWAGWFASFNGTIAIFTAGNVAINKQASENYKPEMDSNRSAYVENNQMAG